MNLTCLVRTVMVLLVISTPYSVQSAELLLTLQVTDQADGVVPTASARLVSLDRVIESKANSNGNVQFGSIAPGTYQLEVFAPGFTKTTVKSLSVPQPESKPIGVTLRVANQPDHCGFVNTVQYHQFQPGAALSGQVIDADSNKGLTKAAVNLLVADTGIPVSSIQSGKHGMFLFTAVQPGRYVVRISKDAYWPSTLEAFFVSRENATTLLMGLDKRGHMHVCQ